MSTADWISDRRALLDAATEGPWEGLPLKWSGIWGIWGTRRDDELGDGEWLVAEIRGKTGDAALVADARTSLPAALDALEAVLELHTPHTETDCGDLRSECFIIFPGKCASVGLCCICRVEYPCPTIAAITETLGVES